MVSPLTYKIRARKGFTDLAVCSTLLTAHRIAALATRSPLFAINKNRKHLDLLLSCLHAALLDDPSALRSFRFNTLLELSPLSHNGLSRSVTYLSPIHIIESPFYKDKGIRWLCLTDYANNLLNRYRLTFQAELAKSGVFIVID